MNRFDEELRQAARRKRNTAAIASLVFVTFGLILAGYFLSFRSLSIEVRPEQARQSSVISIADGLALSFANRIYALSDTARLSIFSVWLCVLHALMPLLGPWLGFFVSIRRLLPFVPFVLWGFRIF